MRLSENVRHHLRHFAFTFANRTLELTILDGIDYDLMGEPSALEMVFAIWSNVIEFGSDGIATNAGHASRRAAQYLRSYCDPTYAVEPPFEDWETEL